MLFSDLSRRGIARYEATSLTNQHRAETYRALSGSIAHEVRNPITMAGQALILFNNRIEKMSRQADTLDPKGLREQLNYLTLITAEAQQCLNRGDVVITMTLANIRDQTVDPASFTPQSVAAVVEQALREFVFRPGEREAIRLHLEQDFEARVDASLLTYVLFNLLKNALYFLHHKADNTISIRLQPGSASNALHFRDNGPGIPAEQMETLFDTFATAGKKGGTGLGLAFCQRMMIAFGGDIRCHSVEGEFTEFTLEFPLPAAKGLAQ